MEKRRICCSRLLFLITLLVSSGTGLLQDGSSSEVTQKLGAIVDLTSRTGKEERVGMEMAIEDFYTNVTDRPVLHIKNSRGDPLRALSLAKRLIKRNRVRAIVGLGTWQDAIVTAELGNNSQVPILSLADEIRSWACLHWPFLVNAAHSQFGQMKAVAAIISSWQWRKVNIIYEDISSDVNGVIPYLISALQDLGLEISDVLPLPPVRSYYSLSEKLEHLKNGQCRVFIVHTSVGLASDIFIEANKLRMMEQDFVWITTGAISNLIDTFNKSVISSMQGVLGVRSYFSHYGKRFNNFRARFGRKFHMLYSQELYSEPGIYSLQAYDAMWAVALAMQGVPHRTSFRNSSDISIGGKKLLIRILQSNFNGLTGIFKFRKGMLTPAYVFDIVNVVGRSYRELGFWTENMGFSESIGVGSKYNKSMRILGQVFWPGGPWSVPRGWSLPTIGKPLIIGVPLGNAHKAFVEVDYDQQSRNISVKGFSIDVFTEALHNLPYGLPHNFSGCNCSYDCLVENVNFQVFDAVVADTAIVANRCEYAEFSQPYSEAGLRMIIYSNPRKLNRAWLFTMPFKPSMWIATGLTNIYFGIVVWLIERRSNPEYNRGNPLKKILTVLSSAFITLFSLKGDGIRNIFAQVVMVPWLFLALVVTQSFTASLTSLLTFQQLEPSVVDAETLRQNGAKVGCDIDSFVGQYLVTVLKFQHDQIVPITSEDAYAQALVSGDIAAAILEVPYVDVFLAKYCKGFIVSGPTYKVGGFGFVFPKGSPYLPDISEAIVKVAESGKLKKLQDSLTSSYNCSASADSNMDHERLEFTSFVGLFVIAWIIPAIALFVFCMSRNICQCQRQQQHPPPQQLDLQQWEQHDFRTDEWQQHDFRTDENVMFAAEMENQRRRHLL